MILAVTQTTIFEKISDKIKWFPKSTARSWTALTFLTALFSNTPTSWLCICFMPLLGPIYEWLWPNVSVSNGRTVTTFLVADFRSFHFCCIIVIQSMSWFPSLSGRYRMCRATPCCVLPTTPRRISFRASPNVSRLCRGHAGQLQVRSSNERLDNTFWLLPRIAGCTVTVLRGDVGMKGASGVSTPRELKFRRSIEPPPPEPSIGDGDGEL